MKQFEAVHNCNKYGIMETEESRLAELHQLLDAVTFEEQVETLDLMRSMDAVRFAEGSDPIAS